MAENSNILITVTTDSEGAVQSINKLGTEVNQAGEKAQTLKQQIRELQNVLTSGAQRRILVREFLQSYCLHCIMYLKQVLLHHSDSFL